MNLVRGRRGALAALCALSLMSLPAAAGARTEVARETSVGAVQLAGERVAYAGATARGRDFVRVSEGAGQATATVFREARGQVLFLAALGASPERLAFEALDDGGEGGDAVVGRLFASGLAGPFGEPLVSCLDSSPVFDVSAHVVAYACPGRDREVTVRDLSTGAEIVIPAGAVVRDVQVAGRFVAYERPLQDSDQPVPQEIVVHSVTRGATEYRVSGEPIGEAPVSFDLQEDGKLAVAAPGAGGFTGGIPCFSRLVWYSPAEPFPHEVARDVCADRVRIGGTQGDRIAHRRANGRELAVSDLAGSARLIARFPVVQGLTTLTDWDYDGSRFAWGERLCAQGAVYVEEAEPATVSGPEPTRCPARLRSRRARMRSGGVVPIRMRCPRGCEFDWDLLIDGRRGEGVLANGHTRVLPGASVARLRVHRSLRRSLRGIRRTRARLEITPYDRIGDTQRPLVRRIRLRLR